MAFAASSCCFFMPLRFGAAVMATLQLLLSAILAIALWIEVSKWSLSVGVRVTGTAAAAATYYTILSFSALLGSIAIFTRSKNILRYFAFCLGWSIGLQLAVSALQLWGYLSTPRDMVVAECVQTSGMDMNTCLRSFALSIGWLITSIVVGLLVQLCSAYVVSSYSSKLSGEDDLTTQAPAPNRFSISGPQRANPAALVAQTTVAATFVNLGDGMEKQWDSSKYSLDGADEKDELRLDPGPPRVPILEPAPPKRIPRVRPAYPIGIGPTSTNSAALATASRATANPFASATAGTPPRLETPPRNGNPFADATKMV